MVWDDTSTMIINSSSAHITLDGYDWLRKTDGGNITWIPLFAEHYYVCIPIENQWWYIDKDAKKFKLDEAPDIETTYQEMPKP
jgi:hypothetical protein